MSDEGTPHPAGVARGRSRTSERFSAPGTRRGTVCGAGDDRFVARGCREGPAQGLSGEVGEAALLQRRPRPRLVALTAACLLATVALSAMAGATPPAAHTRMLALTPALSAAIRSSYYDAYRANPDPLSAFGARAGLPESAVFGPQLLHAGELLATTPAEASSWVVASVCIGSRVGCQDAGAFQVFDRTGLSGAYYLDGFDPCLVPEPLAQIWFPGGRGPLGTHCPAAGELVPRTSLRTGAWTALLPQSWRRVGCPDGEPGAGQAASLQLARRGHRHRRLVRPGRRRRALRRRYLSRWRLLTSRPRRRSRNQPPARCAGTCTLA